MTKTTKTTEAPESMADILGRLARQVVHDHGQAELSLDVVRTAGLGYPRTIGGVLTWSHPSELSEWAQKYQLDVKAKATATYVLVTKL